MTNSENVNLMAEKVTEGSHTPGPWIAASSPSSIVGWPIVGPRGRAVASVHCRRGDTAEGRQINAEARANACLIAASPDMYAILDELEGAFDKEIYPEQVKEDFDALDEREYSVTITAKQWRAISRALSKVQHGK